MRSVASILAEETCAAVLALPVGERIALALRLGDRDVKLHAAARGIDEEQARRLLHRGSQVGRRPSNCARLEDE